FTPELQEILDVTATRELQVRFTLRRPSRGLEDQPFADVPILPRHLWADLPLNRRAPPGLPVGTGPYRLTSYEPRRRYRLKANDDYFRGQPSVERIDVPVIRRQQSILDELNRQRLDAAPVAIPPGTIPQRGPVARYSDETSFIGTMLLFNVRRGPFDRRLARRAVAQALNLKSIAANATSVPGGVVAADRGMLHPRSRWAGPPGLQRFNPEAARLAFVEQGIGAFRVAASRNDPVRLEAGKRVVRALTRVGARARLVELSPRALDRVLGRRDAPASFDAAVVSIPALASYDPAYLRAVFGDTGTRSLNDGGYRSAAFNALAERAVSAPTQRRRRSIGNAQLRLLARDLPAVPLLFGGGTILYRPRAYDGWVDVRGTGILDKRSFLSGQSQRADSPGAAVPDLIDPSSDDGISLVPFIVGVALLMLAGGIWKLRRSRA
ncbi:MAG: ABC transporter substrate-binding protein, partial [Solirubrobacteraceae bacterium]